MLKQGVFIGLLLVFFMLLTAAEFDYRESDWYEVEDWEVEVCSKWGGAKEAESHTGGVYSTEFDEMAATVQASMENISNEDEEMYVYEVSWYLQPMEGSEEYKVSLGGENSETIKKGSAPSTTGDSGYYAEENSSTVYEHVILEYEDDKLKAPVVK